MNDALLDRYRRWRRRLDLDDPRMSLESLEVVDPESGRRTPRRMAVLFLRLVLRQALDDDCVAVNLFYDSEDDCLRGLEYSGVEGTSWTGSREFLPAPGCFAEQVLEEFRWRVAVQHSPGEGTLHYKHQGKTLTALAAVPNASEVRVYFTEERPTVRNKGIR